LGELAIVQQEFTSYVVYYIRRSSPTAGLPQDAEIDCFSATGRAGAIYFYPDGLPLPPNQQTVNGISLYFRTSRFSDVMTMLKEETPLYLNLDTISAAGYVGTSAEPVGEQEQM
jgi:hypothetical protein